jgi:hypothetical protein
MKTLLRGSLLSALLLSTASVAADDTATAQSAAPPVQGQAPEKQSEGQSQTIDVGSTTTGINVDQEFIKRIAVARPGRRNLAESGCYRSCWLSDRDRTPSWMLSRQVISVPDGTPQLVYRAPSADRYSPDFGSR